MTWLLLAATAAVIVVAGVRLARYSDVRGEKSGLGARRIRARPASGPG